MRALPARSAPRCACGEAAELFCEQCSAPLCAGCTDTFEWSSDHFGRRFRLLVCGGCAWKLDDARNAGAL